MGRSRLRSAGPTSATSTTERPRTVAGKERALIVSKAPPSTNSLPADT